MTNEQIATLREAAEKATRCQWGDAFEWAAVSGDRNEGEFIALAPPAAILTLLDHIAKLEAHRDSLLDKTLELAKEIGLLRHDLAATLAKLEADAKRYRWLRDEGYLNDWWSVQDNDRNIGISKTIDERIEITSSFSFADEQRHEAVAKKWEMRTRPTWDEEHPWTEWIECSESAARGYMGTSILNDWEYEVRADGVITVASFTDQTCGMIRHETR